MSLDAFIIRYQSAKLADLKRSLANNTLDDWQIPYIESLIKLKEEEARVAPIVMYHRRKAPDGETFKAHETFSLVRDGWVDSPSKLEKDTRDKVNDVSKTALAFWCKEYKWVLRSIGTAIALYLTYLGLKD